MDVSLVQSTTTNRFIMPAETTNSLDQIYRSNPYPSSFEVIQFSKDLGIETDRFRTWFNNRRRRDWKKGKLCRRCRFFKAPIDDETHQAESKNRPCARFWSLPTVASPPTSLKPVSLLTKNKSILLPVDDKKDVEMHPSKVAKVEIVGQANVSVHTSPTVEPVPSAVSLAVEQGIFNFQPVNVSPEPAWYHPQPNMPSYPLDMSTGNMWMPRCNNPYWHHFNNLSQPTQMPINAHYQPTRFTCPLQYPMATNESYSQTTKFDPPLDFNATYQYFEDGSPSTHLG